MDANVCDWNDHYLRAKDEGTVTASVELGTSYSSPTVVGVKLADQIDKLAPEWGDSDEPRAK